jgi:hypothetical protein
VERKVSKIEKLRRITTQPATADHQEQYDKQTSAKADDRSFCLLLSSMLENDLDRAIDARIGQTLELRKGLYEQDGPLGTFSRKITMAAALQIIGPTTQANFRVIRNIRNAFAHSKIPIAFTTREVSAVCADLVRINIFEPPEEVDQSSDMTARERFATVVHETMLRLTSCAGHNPQFTDDEGNRREIQAPSRNLAQFRCPPGIPNDACGESARPD